MEDVNVHLLGNRQESNSEKSVPSDYPKTATPVESFKQPYSRAKSSAGYEADVIPQTKENVEVISAQSNVISYESSNLNDINIDYFKWLIGSWEASYQNQKNNTQHWDQKDQFTLSGNAILTINGKEILVEEMEIKKIGNQLYFLRIDTESGESIKYNLLSINDGLATFNNAQINDQFSIKQNAFDNFSQQNSPNGALHQSQFPGALKPTINFVKTQKD